MRGSKGMALVFLLGFVLGATAWHWAELERNAVAAGARHEDPLANTVANLSARVDRLEKALEQQKGKLPSQSHTMMDVDYHFTNLWFAAHSGNWDLAQFYLNETRSHMRWAVRVIPVRKDNQGNEVKLVEILQAVENSGLAQLQQALANRDVTAFESAYRFMLENCYTCHKASDKPYLRPHVPQQPATQVINFDPRANWPR